MGPIASKTEVINMLEVEQPALVERAKFGDRFFAAIVDNIIVKIPLTVVFMFLIPLWVNPYFGFFFAICVELVQYSVNNYTNIQKYGILFIS